MPKKTRTTENPFGQKMLDVLRDQGTPDDLQRLAEVFNVKLPSVYDWIAHGRFSKERYADLVRWSGRSLHWWFDVPEDALPLAAREQAASYSSWPFPTLHPDDLAQLDRDTLLRLEGAILALAPSLGLSGKRRAA